MKLKDLGWANAGGNTERHINQTIAICKGSGHEPITTSNGSCVHRTSCVRCGYFFQVDSSG